MRRVLIDRRGKVHSVERGLWRLARHKLPCDSDPATFAVRHLGMIEMEVVESRMGLRVRMQPSIVSSAAISELMYWMAELRPPRFILTHFRRTWQEELVPGFQPMLRRVEELVYGVRSQHPRKAFHAEDQSLDPDRTIIPAPFARLLHQWAQRGGALPDDATLPFRRSGCLGRTTLVEEVCDSRMVIAFRGRHLTHYGHAGWTHAIGRPVEQQPDLRFASAASAVYAEAHVRNAPILQACEGTIAGPSGAGRRSIYDRLILPWRAPDGRRIVSGVSHLRGRIDWRDAANSSASPSIS